jgi:hypothetical protein
MKMLKKILNGIATVFAQSAEALETKADLVAQVKTLETEIEKLKAESADAKDNKLSKKKPFRRKYAQMKNLTTAKKEKLLEEQAESGLSVAAFCRKKGLSNSTFYYWQKTLGKKKLAQTA